MKFTTKIIHINKRTIIMNTHETNKMTMFNSVMGVLGSNQEIVKARPPLAEASENLNQTVADIERINGEYIGVTEGAVAAKNNALDDLIERVFRLGNGIFALGRKTGNEQYKSAGNQAISDLKNMREADVVNHCSKIAEIAGACAAELAVFDVTAGDIEAFNKALETYRQKVTEKEVKTAESKAARKSLRESFKKADDILSNDIDTLMELVKTGSPAFYRLYRAARTIRDIGGGHVSKNGKPVETLGPAPLVIAKAA